MTDKPETRATSLGRMSEAHFGAVNTPVYRASTILFPDMAALKANRQPYTYGRRGTPTTRSFEDAISDLEGAARTVSVTSGAQAIALAILSVCGAGDHLLMVDSAYEPTRIFCDRTLKRFGVETTYYAPDADIAPLLKPNTRAVFCESPGSLTFEVQDIPAIVKAAHAKGVSVLMDNTWATPIFFQPLKHGVDLSIQAATKYVGGHADVMLGYVAANEGHAARLHETHGNMGLYASGDDCFLGLRGLRTLPVRLERHQANGLALARWLRDRPEIARILHPGLEGDPGHALWKRDFSGACGLFGVILKPVPEAAVAALVDGLTHFGIGYSWGGFESLVVPAHIHRTARAFDAEGPVLRFHAGLEDAGDLIADLEQGLARLRKFVTDTLTHAAFVSAIKFDDNGLVPAIAQSKDTGQVLMFAWMTRETLEATLATGHVTYWSRSRKSVWKKGETSGNHQRLVEAFVDCDGDVLLLKVDQMGPACHTGAPSCFFRKLR